MLFPSRHPTLPRSGGISSLPFLSALRSLATTRLVSVVVLIASTYFLSAVFAAAAVPTTLLSSLEIFAEVEFIELDIALGFLGMMGERSPSANSLYTTNSLYATNSTHATQLDEASLTSGLDYLCKHIAYDLQHPSGSADAYPSPSFTVLQDSTKKSPQPVSTTATTTLGAKFSTTAMLSTDATLSTDAVLRAKYAKNIPLLSEPTLNLDELADSLSVRRSASGGAINRQGIDKIPFSGQNYNFQAQFDSTTQSAALRMRIGDRLLGSELRPSQTQALDNYLGERREYIRQQTQDSILHHYDFRRPFKLELSSLLGQANNFNIPFPQNPLTGIFGKPGLSLNANFEINLRIGSQWNGVIGVGQASTLGAVQWVPIFQPNVQANIDAKLGDKLGINLDMNTLRQFEFDNLTRIAYDGEPDEIFRRIEFGNVTLNSPSAFISGSQALFGVRTDFQFGPVYVKTVASYKRGQSKVATVKGGSVKQAIALRAYDYADNHFFINSAHKSVVWPVFEKGGFPLQATPNTQIYTVKALEVWESTPDQREIQAAEVIAFDTLRPLTASGTVVNGTPTYSRQERNTIFDTTKINAGRTERGRFRKLAAERYTFDQYLGTLRILNLRKDRTYAIAYRLQGQTQGDNDDIVYGTFQNTLDPSDTTKLILQLVYRPNMQPAFKNIWARQRQNVYFIGATNVSKDPKDTRINFWYLRPNNDSADVLQGVPDKLATVLGVDRVNNTSGAGTPDGVFDINLPYIFDAARGEISFPSLEPFRQGIRDYFQEKSLAAEGAIPYLYSAVYDTTRDAARLDAQHDRFVISGEVSGQSSNRINLPNAFNLAPGGVKVKLNGQTLVEYQDYRVEYFTGQVELLNPQALLPNANVEVEYEQNDAFNLATRSMLGVRLDLDTKSILRSRDVRLDVGMTLVNYAQDNPSARIRLGEEPLSNTMLGVDGQVSYNADWLTKALDWLPFYDTKAPSSISAKGEVAWMLPIPNTRVSEIASDNGAAAVYIDDFEATQRIYALGIQPSQWRHASPPDSTGIPLFRGWKVDSIQKFRGGMHWFAFNELRVKTTDIYPNRAITVGLGTNQNTRVLEIDFNPHERGIYNTNPNFRDSLTYIAEGNGALGGAEGYKNAFQSNQLFSTNPANKSRIWGGFMRSLSAFNLNFDNENMDFIEIVIRPFPETDPNLKMYIDVGQISEDVIPNGQLDTEDGILPGKETPNGRIAEGEAEEDVGLDGLSNAQERGDTTNFPLPPIIKAKYPKGLPYAADIRNEADPARDDFRYDWRKFSTVAANALQKDSDFVNRNYNGVENNRDFTDTQFPDTEILNANNGQTLAQANDYFRYEVDLRADIQNPQFVNRTDAGFITLRIPLRGVRTNVNNPLFSNIQYVRAIFMGGRFKGQIADWRFVGSQWIKQPVFVAPQKLDSTTLSVGFVGREENAGAPFFYTMPPDVQPPTDRNNFLNPNQFRNEQSLLMQFKDLPGWQERAVSRFFRPFDAFFYKQMKFFLYGDANSLSPPAANRTEARAIAFIRFGVDTLNYYEYNVPLKQGWQTIALDLDTLTGKKPVLQLTRDSAGLVITPAPNLGEYRVKGSPTLTRIQFVSFGVRNPRGDVIEKLGMWVNELRLVQPDATQQWDSKMAAVGSASAKIADLGSVTATVNMQTPYFHKLEERFGNRNNRLSLAVTGQFEFGRFFPESWQGTSLPVSFTYNETTDKPRFLPQNDVSLITASTNEASRLSTDSDRRKTIADSIQNSQETYIKEMQIALTGARLNIPSYFFLVRDFLNRITVDYNFALREERSPVLIKKDFSGWRFRTAYNHTFQPLPIKPFGWTETIPALSFLKDWTIFPYPNTLGASMDLNQSAQYEQSRIESTLSIPPVFNFDLTRQLQFSWKMEENGLLNETLDYSVNTVGTMMPLWLEPSSTTKTLSAGETWRNVSSLFGGTQTLNLGTDTKHGQNFRLTFRPKLPDFMGGSKFFTVTGSFGTQYGWERLLRPLPPAAEDLNKAAGYQNAINATFGVRLKDLGNTLFPTLGAAPSGMTLTPGQPNILGQPNSTQAANTSIADAILRTVKSVFFDWEQFNITFTQQSNANNPGVFGSTGWGNFANDATAGPGMAYQLGLVQEPHNYFQFVRAPNFPFFQVQEVHGPRPRNVDLPDIYKQANTLDMRTQREIIPGLQIELSWLSKIDFNRNRIARQLDNMQVPEYSNTTILQTYGRSYFAPFPSISRVAELFNERTQTITGTTGTAAALKQDALNDAFLEGLEANPAHWFRGSDTTAFRNLLRILPNLNFALRWNGLDQLSFFKGILRSGSLEMKYQGRYSATNRREAEVETLDQQSVTSSFEPLIGITAQFDDKFVEGVMSGNLRYGTKSSFGIAQSQQGIVQSEVSSDFTMQITYTRRGFELPKIGGLSLLKLIGIDFEFTNDIEFGLQATYRKMDRTSINVLAPPGEAGTVRRIDGTTNILFEPSMRYTISKQVTARLFFRYEANLTEGAVAPGSSTTVVGVDLRLNLSGGRSF